MKLQRRQFLHLAAGAAALPALSRIANAQAYPSRPITVVVPFAAGGPTAESFSVPFDLYPSALQEVCDDVFRELREGLERFLKLLRWQQEIDARIKYLSLNQPCTGGLRKGRTTLRKGPSDRSW